MEDDFAVEYQNHSVCTECKYDSHCQIFNPLSFCYEEGNTTPDGEQYKVGNPMTANIQSYLPKDFIRDEGRVTDG